MEVRPSFKQFAATMWPRNALLIVWLAISLALAIAGTAIGAAVALAIVAWETYLALSFFRSVVRVDEVSVSHRSPTGALRRFDRNAFIRAASRLRDSIGVSYSAWIQRFGIRLESIGSLLPFTST